MNAMHWYPTELLLQERKQQLEHDARLAADLHLARSSRRTRRFGRRH